MRHNLKATGLAALLAAGLATATLAAAPEGNAIGESQSVSTALSDNASALTYWVSEPDGWHVVTTVDTVLAQDKGEGHAIVRFSAVLLPGQSQLISVPAALGAASQSLRISRHGDRIEVERVAGST